MSSLIRAQSFTESTGLLGIIIIELLTDSVINLLSFTASSMWFLRMLSFIKCSLAMSSGSSARNNLLYCANRVSRKETWSGLYWLTSAMSLMSILIWRRVSKFRSRFFQLLTRGSFLSTFCNKMLRATSHGSAYNLTISTNFYGFVLLLFVNSFCLNPI